MKTKIIIANIALALTVGIIYTGCKKEDDVVLPTETEDISAESENSMGENSYSEIFRSISEVSEAGSLRAGGCATITIDTTAGSVNGGWPKTVTIDYGAGCNGKKGKVTAVFTGGFGAPGTIITITTDSNYYFGANKINVGLHTITNNGGNFKGHKSFSVNIISGILTIPGGKKVSWNSTRTIEWIAGDTTLSPLDDVYSITGTTTGISSKGVVFSSTITSPLIVAVSCPWIESGVIVMIGKNGKSRTIDFGTTGCDNQATITVASGKVYNITM